MKCEKCGKEIPDGGSKLCDDCAKEVFDSAKENKEKFNFAKFVKQNLKILLIILVIVILLLLCLKVLSSKEKVGNSIGNIRNYGYVASDGNWIYYLAPNEDSSSVGIYRVKGNGSKKEQLLMEDDMDIISINYYKGYLYFIGIIDTEASIDTNEYALTEENADEFVNNKIFRLKADGSKELEVINDNNFHDDCYEIYVINDYVYYIGVDQNIYKMKLNGSDSEIVSENKTGYIGINENYIIYNVYNVEAEEDEDEDEEDIDVNTEEVEVEEVETTSADEYVTYIMDINGENPRPIIDGKRLYSVNIVGDYVYYTNYDKKIYKTKIDSKVEELILDTTAFNLNYYKDYLYYFNYDNPESESGKVCIFRIKTNGKGEPEKLKALETYSAFLDVSNNRIVFMDANDDYGYIKLIKLDGSQEKTLYELNYNSLDESSNSEEDSSDIE